MYETSTCRIKKNTLLFLKNALYAAIYAYVSYFMFIIYFMVALALSVGAVGDGDVLV